MPDSPTNSLQQGSDEVRYPVNFPGGVTTPGSVSAYNMPFTPKPRSELTEIRYKKQRGEQLTEDETVKLAAAGQKYAPCKVTIHVRAERKKIWKELAKGQKSLSTWIVLMVEKAVASSAPCWTSNGRLQSGRARNLVEFGFETGVELARWMIWIPQRSDRCHTWSVRRGSMRLLDEFAAANHHGL